eukprot:351620_1
MAVPATKKRKVNDNSVEIQSTIFLNSSDHSQFQQLFTSIYNSELSQILNIPCIVNKEIAEFATGQFVKCNNPQCDNEIIILCQDEQIYDNNHDNSGRLGYKYCLKTPTFNRVHGLEGVKQYYCNQCMDLAKTCDCNCCNTLYFALNCEKCHLCKADLCDCGCLWECMNSNRSCAINKCGICGFKSCAGCARDIEWGMCCSQCGEYFCLSLCHPEDSCGKYLGGDDQVCNNCYDDQVYNN